MIEKAIPVPIEEESTILDRFPEFAQMKIGDSILIANENFHTGDFMLVAIFGIKSGHRHSNRTYSNGDVRFWRIK